MNILLILNGSPENINIFRIHFQDAIRAFHLKSQVWKSKLQTCLKPSKVVFIMYIAHTLQVNLLMKNVLRFIEQENGHSIEIAIQSEAAFQTNEDRKKFNKSYGKTRQEPKNCTQPLKGPYRVLLTHVTQHSGHPPP